MRNTVDQKLWHKTHVFLLPVFGNFVKEKSKKFLPLHNYFWPFFCQLHENCSQNWGSDNHFEVLSVSKF
jgi:hypothetical protein